MKKSFFDYGTYFLFLFISFFCLVGFIGFENISFQSTKWLHLGNDTTLPQFGWHFFKNDIWRFPLGANPNYGDELGSSIVFSDSIPILALFFKLFKSFIPGSSQYISFWYFICFFFQLFFSFKILKKFTNSTLFSFIGSMFFLIAPIFIWKFPMVPALAGQWILLFALYLGLTKKVDEVKSTWFFLSILSSLISFYFMVMVIASYFLLRIFNFKLNKTSFFILVKDFALITVLLFITLYLVGYFEVRMVDTLSLGFGRDKLNLLSIFDPVNTTDNIRWSWFLPDIKLDYFEENVGFNFFGLGQICMVLLAFFLFIFKKYKNHLLSIKNNKNIKFFLFISIFFTLWALSNKISLGSYVLLEIPLNKYLYGLLSIVRRTGTLFWVAYYFILILSIIIIYQCFNKKSSLTILFIFLIIQIADTSIGIKQSAKRMKIASSGMGVQDKIWQELFTNYKIVKSTYPRNYSGLFSKFSYAMERNNIEKTNIVKLARINRKAAAKGKYHLYDNFRKKTLASDTVYAVYGLSHLRHLKYLFKNENVGFFYRDDVWAMVKNEKERMNDNDKKIFNEIKPKLLALDEKKNLNFLDNDNYYGFGWSHNFSKKIGAWSEGPTSTLFFRTNKNHGDLKLEIFCSPYITKKNKILEFDIYVNNMFNQNIKLANRNQDEKIEILINEKLIKYNEIKIDFNFKNLVSPYEVLESPDARKLGILIKNIKLNSN